MALLMGLVVTAAGCQCVSSDAELYACDDGASCPDGFVCETSINLCLPTSVPDGGEPDGGVGDGGRRTGLCSDAGWCWDNIFPQGNTLNDVFVLSASDVWAAGNEGTVLHYDGEGWTLRQLPVSRSISSIWAAGPDDVWVVGSNGLIARWKGGAWEMFPTGLLGYFHDVWASGPNDVWFVGDGGTVRRFANGQLIPVSVPVTSMLSAVGGFGNQRWVLGTGGVVIKIDTETGSTTQVAGPAGPAPSLDSVSVVGPDDFWACANYVGGTTNTSVLYRYKSGAWTSWTRSEFLDRVWAAGPDDVWAAGSKVVLRYTAATGAWASTPRDFFFNSVHGASPNEVWTVGNYGTIERFDGSRWHQVHEGVGGSFESLYAASPSDIWVLPLATGAAPARFDGTNWSALPALDGGRSAIHGAGGDDIWAVGSSGGTSHWNGTGWTSKPSGTTSNLWSVWMVSPTVGYAVGFGGAVQRLEGGAFVSDGPVLPVTLNDVWAAPSGEAWAVGANGVIAHRGDAWDAGGSSGINNTLYAVWGTSSEELFIGGADLLAVGKYPSQWTLRLFATHTFRDIHGTSPTNVWAVGRGPGSVGAIQHFDGTQWTEIPFGFNNPLDAVYVAPDGEVLVVGGGVFRRKAP